MNSPSPENAHFFQRVLHRDKTNKNKSRFFIDKRKHFTLSSDTTANF